MTCPRCNGPANEETLREFGGVCPKCLLQFSEEQDAPAFPNLEIVEMIGQGGMGVVYKARQKNLDRIVALKVLSPHLSEDPEFVERFTREAKALAQLSHPNIVGIHDSGIHDRVPYLVMEYIDGTPLRNAMAGGKLTPAKALEVIPQICDALQYAHSHGVVHRDIKPENILIDRQGRVKIADFGLAKLSVEKSKLTQSGFVMGTPRYMAPEQFEPAGKVDHRADIYSLGVVFYEMLTGEVPMGRFKPPSAKADVDQRLDPVVLKSLEREPEDRYQSADEVKDQVAGLKTPAPPERPGPAEVKETPDSLKQWASVLATMGVVSFPAGLIMAFTAGGTTAKMMLAVSSALLIAALVVWLIGLAHRHFSRPRVPEPFSETVALKRVQIRGCLIFLLIGVLGFLALIALLMWPGSAPRPPRAVVTVPAPPPPALDGPGGRFHLEDAWPKPQDLPSGLRLENVLEGKAALPDKGKLADALPDLKLLRKATLAEGRVVLFGFEFKTDYARRRWEKELSLLPVKLENGKEPEGRSLFHLGGIGPESSAAATAAIELMEPVLQRKMREAAGKYRE
jgi:tRNA A-37 threonylcarbamoyl transferase component Bud32